MRAAITLNWGQALKAVGIFLLALLVALLVAFGLGAFVPTDECAFPVFLDRQPGDGTWEASVIKVRGTYPVADLGYKVVLPEAQGDRIVQEGNLTDLSTSSPGISFHRVDPAATVLQAGDRFTMEMEGEVHLILLDAGGTPVGWTQGCEV